MRRMYSESELTNLIKNYVTSGDGVFNIKKLTITADESVSYNGLEVSGNVILNDNVYTDGDVFDITGGIVGIGGSIHSINDNNKITIFGSDIEIVDGMDSEGGNLTAKTLKQTEPNYLFQFEVMVEDTTNFEKTGTQYCRIEEVNGEIHIIIMARFKNIDPVNAHSTRLAQYEISNIPEYLSSKIYGVNGSINQPNAGVIRIAPIGIEGSGSPAIYPCRLRGATTPNTIILYQSTGISVNAQDYITFTLEVNLSVL